MPIEINSQNVQRSCIFPPGLLTIRRRLRPLIWLFRHPQADSVLEEDSSDFSRLFMASIKELMQHQWCYTVWGLWDWVELSFNSICHEYELALDLNLNNDFFFEILKSSFIVLQITEMSNWVFWELPNLRPSECRDIKNLESSKISSTYRFTEII